MLPSISGQFRLVTDPTLKFSPSGVAVGGARIVADKKKKDESGEWVDDRVCWLSLTTFKKVAENMAESFKKGDLILVSGRLETQSYQTKEGESRQSYNVIADFVGSDITWDPAPHVKAERAQRKQAPDEDPWATPPPEEWR